MSGWTYQNCSLKKLLDAIRERLSPHNFRDTFQFVDAIENMNIRLQNDISGRHHIVHQ